MAALACALTFSSGGLHIGLDGCPRDSTTALDAGVAYTQLPPLRKPPLSEAQASVVAGLEPVGIVSARRTIADLAYEELTSGRIREGRAEHVFGTAASLTRPYSGSAGGVLAALDRGVDRILALVSSPRARPSSLMRTASLVRRPSGTPDFAGPPEFTGPRRLGTTVRVKHPLPFDPLAEAAFEGAAAPPMFAAADEDFHTVPLYVHKTHTIRKGETISDVLQSAGVSRNEADEWIAAVRRVYNVNRVYVGQRLSVVVDGPSGDVVGMELDLNGGSRLVAELEDGRVMVHRDSVSYTRDIRAVSGTITKSLYESALAKGIPEKVVSEVAEVLGWELNFSRDLRSGAKYKIVYEQMTAPGGKQHYAGRVLAVEITNRGRHYEGFYYADSAERKRGYYDRDGKALGRYFLRYPVEFSRISSRFSKSRLHPITHRRQPHYGVDFAAPTGTPVRAVASGRVLRASWYRGNGRFVKIRHNSVYETGYAHLSRIARSVHAGGTVKQGQIIGYVGSSGLATGPHLHFALYKNGAYIDPLKAKLPRADALTGAALVAHKVNLGLIDRAYSEAARDPSGSVVVAALSDVAKAGR